jgi:hypothetical protein
MAIPEILVKIGASIEGLKKVLLDAEGKLKDFGTKAQKIGTALSVGLTTPLLLIGRASLGAASDAEETASKFETVFSAISVQAQESFKTLRNEYGLSSTASKQLLGDTGDLLSGFGFSQESALDLATQVAKLGVDLASFTNFSGGAKGASEALTKALLGERESVKALGIAILDEDVKKQVAINTAKGLTFETERQAQAYATLDIALAQSKNSIGDFSRTSDQFANQQRIASERIQEVSESLGKVFLPLATKVAGIVIEAANSFNELSDSTKETVVILAAIAAGIGPVLLGIGTAIKLLPFLVSGITALTGPIGIVVLALSLAATTIIFNFEEVKTKLQFAALEIITVLKSIVSSVGLLTSLIPGFTSLVNTSLIVLDQTGKSIAKSIADSFKKVIAPAIDDTGTSLDNINPKIKQTLEEFSKLADIRGAAIDLEIFSVKVAEEDAAFRNKLGEEVENKLSSLRDIIQKSFSAEVIEVDIKLDAAPVIEIPDIDESSKSRFLSNLQEFSQNINDILKNNIASAFSDLGTNIGQALATGANVISEIGKSLLNSISSFLGDLGQQLIAYGVAGLSFGILTEAITKGGPLAIPAAIGAIAAGTALMAISGSIKSLAGKRSGMSSGGGGGGGMGAGSSFTGTGGMAFAGSRDINLMGSFRIDGNDLLYVIDRTKEGRI